MTDRPQRRMITPPTLAAQLGVHPDKVHQWIRSGELAAIDASVRRGERPRYLIDIDDVAAFKARRAVVPAAKPTVRRRAVPADVKQYV